MLGGPSDAVLGGRRLVFHQIDTILGERKGAMTLKERFVILLTLVCLFLVSIPGSAMAKKGLFVNLTSADLNRSVKATSLAIAALDRGDIAVTILLNVDGAQLADKKMVQRAHSIGKTSHQMFREFMEKGGSLMICPLCMRVSGGLKETDLIAGCTVASPDRVLDLMFTEGTKILSY